MSTEHIIRAWRDEEYRESLNAEQRAALPESPVGAIDLTESEMAEAEGGVATWTPTILISSVICTILSI
jgi:mersacidin/lichenicidin family type 2 lantibiotic